MHHSNKRLIFCPWVTKIKRDKYIPSVSNTNTNATTLPVSQLEWGATFGGTEILVIINYCISICYLETDLFDLKKIIKFMWNMNTHYTWCGYMVMCKSSNGNPRKNIDYKLKGDSANTNKLWL